MAYWGSLTAFLVLGPPFLNCPANSKIERAGQATAGPWDGLLGCAQGHLGLGHTSSRAAIASRTACITSLPNLTTADSPQKQDGCFELDQAYPHLISGVVLI